MTVKKTSKSKGVSFIVTATFNYGPFKTKSQADDIKLRIASQAGVVATSVKKTSRGYTFMSHTHIGATTASERDRAVATIRKHAPSAKISIKKM